MKHLIFAILGFSPIIGLICYSYYMFPPLFYISVGFISLIGGGVFALISLDKYQEYLWRKKHGL